LNSPSFYGFKGSAQHLGWSANLRIRTIKAVNFLEATKLIEVNIKNKKQLKQKQKSFVSKNKIIFEAF
jgi:hypothetical protein